MSFGNVIKILASLVLGVAVATVSPSGAAHAGAYGCNGTLVDTINQRGYDGTVLAVSYIYWDGTYNCHVAVKKAWVGTATKMRAEITSQKGGYDEDYGSFSSYAGPVKVDGRNTCINIDLAMWGPGGAERLQNHTPYSGWFHCG